MTSDEKHENQENTDIQSNTLDQETRANSNSTERTDTEKVEKTEQQTTNENLEAESDTELPPKPEGQAELEAKQAEGYEHVSESAVNLHHVGELEPSDIPPSLGGEAEINFPWDEEDTADAELSEENETEEAELPAKTEEAELPAETEDAAVPAEAEETAEQTPVEENTVQTPEQAAKQQTEAEYLAELPFVKIFNPQNRDEATKIFKMGELEKANDSTDDPTVVAGQAAKEDDESKQPKNRKEARKAKREERKKNPRGPIRYLPVWLRLLIVIALCFAGLVVGLMVGYGLIGDGENPQDVLKIEFWESIYDYIQGK